ncbi:MAG: tetratricopeptide repeat protein [Acidiferrobacterales bacterium]
MGLNKNLVCALLLCGGSLYGCATSTPQPSEPQPVVTTTTAPSTKKPAISERTKRDYARALAAIKAKRHKQAERVLLEITQAQPHLAGPHVNLGIVYHRTGRLKEAEQAFRSAIALNPKRPDTYNHLGIVLRAIGRFKEAHEVYGKALQLKPNYEYAHLNLGILYDLYLLNTSKALEHYEQYQKLLVSEDKQVAKWIVDLKRRAKRTQRTAMR